MNDSIVYVPVTQATLDIEDAAAKTAGRLKGRYILRPYGDGHAIYQITGTTKIKANIIYIDISDAEPIPGWGKVTDIPISAARMWLDRRDAPQAKAKAVSEFWASQEIGGVIHFAHGSGQFVRGIVIEHEGERKMQPTALVGAWPQNLVYQRQPDGSVSYGHHARLIVTKTPMEPSIENIVEYPKHKLRGGDPRTMPELSLTPEDMTKDERSLAINVRLYDEVTAALRCDRSSNPITYNRAILAALRGAKRILLEWEE